MNTAERKELHRQLKQLRADWKMWKTCRGLSDVLPCWGIDFMLICPHGGCEDPTCEGCRATAYRAGRLAEIEAKAARLKDAI